MKYYIEGNTSTLRECTPEECEYLDFAIEIGDSFTYYGEAIWTEDFDYLPYETTNSCWSKYVDKSRTYCEDGKERISPNTIWFDLYSQLSEAGKSHFMDWIHGEWDFSEEDLHYMTGHQMMRAALGQKVSLKMVQSSMGSPS